MADQTLGEVVDMIDATAYPLREPCKYCGAETGTLTFVGGQNVVRCGACGKGLYNAPRVETGEAQRSVTTVHNGIKPKQRMRIFQRASGRCEICGGGGNLHLGHALSVKDGLDAGFTEVDLNSDENLFACCEECNLGLGSEPLPIRLHIGLLRRRIQRLADGSP
jgi:ribosomal protein S27E